MSLIVFTDLDGSLMDHETYSIEPARGAIAELAARNISLVLNSSKTAEEIATIQARLQLSCPFICENGAALHQTNRDAIEFGTPRAAWLADVHALRAQHGYDFEGFSDWSSTYISNLTGLSIDQAEQAKARHYSEPILWTGSEADLQQFQSELKSLSLQLLQGGRFQSIQGLYDKSDAMNWMVANASPPNSNQPPLVVALGDSPNDAAMLNSADTAVIIKSGKSSLLDCPKARRLMRTTLPGPAGWSQAMWEILKLYDSGQL